jgi:putative membrane protein
MKTLIAVGLATALVSVQPVAHAQTGNPAFASPASRGIETGRPAGESANTPDQVFLREAALGNRAEVDLAKLAGQRASSPRVKDFASRMSSDHGGTLKKLEGLARSTGTPLPGDLDMDHQVVKRQLEGLRGGQFDTDYMRAQITDHQRTAQLLSYEISSGQHGDVRSLATDMLPAVLEHLEMAKAILAELSGTAS